MDSFADRIAVITGGGDGMGRSLAVELAAEGCHVAVCDLSEPGMEETLVQCRAAAPEGTRFTSFRCDVSSEEQFLAFRDHVQSAFATDHVHLVFNNAGIGGGGSFVNGTRDEWEQTFAVCWYGVYYGTRTFLPLLIKADAGHVVNTSSVNGFWASLGPARAHTAYAAAKFAVKGFTEALVTDLRLNAPHVQASVVMPGHIGTGIALNSSIALGKEVSAQTTEWAAGFRNHAPTTAVSAASIILQGVRTGRWRILVGEDANILDQMVRDRPEEAYETSFVARMKELNVLPALVV